MPWLLAFLALLGGLGVVMGAVVAHVVGPDLSSTLLKTLDTATTYHQLYSLFLFLLVWVNTKKNGFFQLPKELLVCFVSGVCIFCGSLYCVVFFSWTQAAHVAPLGGILLIVAWFWLAYCCMKQASTF